MSTFIVNLSIVQFLGQSQDSLGQFIDVVSGVLVDFVGGEAYVANDNK